MGMECSGEEGWMKYACRETPSGVGRVRDSH